MSWIQLYNSEFFDFNDLSIDNISIETIAHSLSMQCRFNGHCNKFYSVAEHSVRVCARVYYLAGGATIPSMFALLHDASEAILCDIPSPLKRLNDMRVYREAEKDVQNKLFDKLGYGYDEKSAELTLQADLELLATEKEQIMSKAPIEWGELPEPLVIYKLAGWSPYKAKEEFLKTYNELKSVHSNG